MLYLNALCSLVHFHLGKVAMDSGQIQRKVTLLVGMDLLVHAGLLYSIKLRSGLRQLRGHITEDYKIPGAMVDVVANDYSLLLFSLFSPHKNKLSVCIICW